MEKLKGRKRCRKYFSSFPLHYYHKIEPLSHGMKPKYKLKIIKKCWNEAQITSCKAGCPLSSLCFSFLSLMNKVLKIFHPSFFLSKEKIEWKIFHNIFSVNFILYRFLPLAVSFLCRNQRF